MPRRPHAEDPKAASAISPLPVEHGDDDALHCLDLDRPAHARADQAKARLASPVARRVTLP